MRIDMDNLWLRAQDPAASKKIRAFSGGLPSCRPSPARIECLGCPIVGGQSVARRCFGSGPPEALPGPVFVFRLWILTMNKLHLFMLTALWIPALSACDAKERDSKGGPNGIGGGTSAAPDTAEEDSASDNEDSEDSESEDGGDEDSSSDEKGDSSSKKNKTSTGGENDSDSGDDTSPEENPGGGGDPGNADEVCKRWNRDTKNKSEGSWSGNVAECKAGDIDKETRARTLAQVNLMRWLAELPPVKTDPAYDKKAQACAIIMHANKILNHYPTDTWKCYTPEGAEGAMRSNISSGPGVMSVMLYMIDDGNPTTIGHRRWILANNFGPTGLGSTSKASCMWTMGGKGTGKRKWTAWPPPGVFPLEAGRMKWGSTLDQVGWTIQSDVIDLSGKTVTVTVNGKEQPVNTAGLLPGYGSRQAIKINPKGWQMKDGSTYRVKVEGTDIDYKFTVKKCG